MSYCSLSFSIEIGSQKWSHFTLDHVFFRVCSKNRDNHRSKIVFLFLLFQFGHGPGCDCVRPIPGSRRSWGCWRSRWGSPDWSPWWRCPLSTGSCHRKWLEQSESQRSSSFISDSIFDGTRKRLSNRFRCSQFASFWNKGVYLVVQASVWAQSSCWPCPR